MRLAAHKRALRKEILILKAQAYRTEIVREVGAMTEGFGTHTAADHFSNSSLWKLFTSGNGRIARWLRWGSTFYSLLPVLTALFRKKTDAA